ncbi:MAG: hypothetical protein KBD63_01760 [Bacteriovoracaceae bacterium]|nr:hypothetical protein [Bacteriovoracaceae bacterium]
MTCFLFMIGLTACAGYRIKDKENPFAEYDIQSVSIPYFFNKGVIPNASNAFTSEIIQALSNFPKLNILAGDGKKADAVLLGIITTPQYYTGEMQTVTTSGYRPSEEVAPNATQGRIGFFIPQGTLVKATLNLILIKNPTEDEIKLMTSDLGNKIIGHPKIVFNRLIDVSTTFGREIYDTGAGGDETAINMTQNKGNFDRAVKRMAGDAANQFKQTILYAF